MLGTALACLAFNCYFLEFPYSFAVSSQETVVAGSLSVAQRSATDSLRCARSAQRSETLRSSQSCRRRQGAPAGEPELRFSHPFWCDRSRSRRCLDTILEVRG